MQRIPILLPLAVGAVVFAGTVLIHAFPLSATVNFVRRERQLGRAGDRTGLSGLKARGVAGRMRGNGR